MCITRYHDEDQLKIFEEKENTDPEEEVEGMRVEKRKEGNEPKVMPEANTLGLTASLAPRAILRHSSVPSCDCFATAPSLATQAQRSASVCDCWRSSITGSGVLCCPMQSYDHDSGEVDNNTPCHGSQDEDSQVHHDCSKDMGQHLDLPGSTASMAPRAYLRQSSEPSCVCFPTATSLATTEQHSAHVPDNTLQKADRVCLAPVFR